MKWGLLCRYLMVVAALTAVVAAPVQAAARRPAVRIRSVQQQIDGKTVTELQREVRLAFIVRYRVLHVSTRRHASARIRISFTRRSDTLAISTDPAATESGAYRWEVTGPDVRIPPTYPAGTYRVRLVVEIVRRGRVIAKRARAWDARVT